MKNLENLLTLLSMVALMAAYGCSKDDNEAKSLGTLQIGTKEASLTNGFILDYGDCAEIYLCTSGLNYEEENGSGHFVYFTVYPRTGDTYIGSYTYSEREDTTGTFEYCEYYYNMKLVDGYISDYDLYGYATDGSITIAKSGNIYTIEIACSGYNGISYEAVTFTASYTGALKYYSEQGKKSTGQRRMPFYKN
jgi:hypothetical protein